MPIWHLWHLDYATLLLKLAYILTIYLNISINLWNCLHNLNCLYVIFVKDYITMC